MKLDWQHAVDLGTTSYELGESIWSMLPALATSAGDGSRSDHKFGLKEFKRRLRQYYHANRTDSRLPLGRFGLTKIKGRGHPKLKAKAVQTKRLVPFGLGLAEEFRALHGEMGEHRYQSLRYVDRICGLASRRELRTQDLANWRWWQAVHMWHYTQAGYRVYPKFHFAMHLPQQIECGGAPRMFWVYSDESKNGQVRDIWRMCSKGHSVHQQILLHLIWLFELKAQAARL